MKPALTPERLDRALTETATAFEVPRREVVSRCRAWSVVRARLALYAALYGACETTYAELGRRLRRDHTTILHGHQRAVALADVDPEYADRLGRIAAACK